MQRQSVRWVFLIAAVLSLAGGFTGPASRVRADDPEGPVAYKDLADHNPIMTQRFGADPATQGSMLYDP